MPILSPPCSLYYLHLVVLTINTLWSLISAPYDPYWPRSQMALTGPPRPDWGISPTTARAHTLHYTTHVTPHTTLHYTCDTPHYTALHCTCDSPHKTALCRVIYIVVWGVSCEGRVSVGEWTLETDHSKFRVQGVEGGLELIGECRVYRPSKVQGVGG